MTKSQNFYLKTPGSKSGKSKLTQFAIYQQTVNLDGSTKNKTLDIPELNALNESLGSNRLSLIEATKSAKSILKQLKVQRGLADGLSETFNSENQNILNKFLDDYFKRKRYIVDKESAKNKFVRAVNSIGELSLTSSSEDALLTKILDFDYDDNKKRDLIAKLNSILKFIKRDIVLSAPSKTINEVLFLTESEVIKVANQFEDITLKNLCLLSFYSGLRIGETLALTNTSLRADNTINVDYQIDRDNKKRLPKNKKKRRAFLIEQGIDSFKYWVTNKDAVETSRNAVSKQFKKACKKIFKSKPCKWHDLRHSYAVHLIGKGIPIQLVAQSMGNSIKVCEEYYSGFVLTDIGLSTIKSMLLNINGGINIR